MSKIQELEAEIVVLQKEYNMLIQPSTPMDVLTWFKKEMKNVSHRNKDTFRQMYATINDYVHVLMTHLVDTVTLNSLSKSDEIQGRVKIQAIIKRLKLLTKEVW